MLDPRVKDTCFNHSVLKTIALNNLRREFEDVNNKKKQ